MKKKILTVLSVVLTLCFVGCSNVPANPIIPSSNNSQEVENVENEYATYKIRINDEVEIDSFSGNAYITINDNIPYFTKDDYTTEAFEIYSDLDDLGRCGVTYANICKEIMPTEERGEIGHIKPSGWHTVKYDCVEGKYLYNRCHLIGFQLAGENDNEKNLITGTRYLNIQGMLEYENLVADYVKETNNHVLYRVTPIYTGNNLVADGVLMEGYSVEDKGKGIQFCIFSYNAQPGVGINYATGESWLLGEEPIISEPSKEYKANEEGIIYILNTNSKKYHLDTCANAEKISEHNKESFNGTIEWLEDNGYEPCGLCKPNEK